MTDILIALKIKLFEMFYSCGFHNSESLVSGFFFFFFLRKQTKFFSSITD